MKVNKFRAETESHIEDNFGSIMPVMLYRVTWKDIKGNYKELWTGSRSEAHRKKHEVDHSNEVLSYVNFEGWFAYRSIEHDAKYGREGKVPFWLLEARFGEKVNRFRNQWENHIDDNFASIMPMAIYRVTWKDRNDQYQEFWTESDAESRSRQHLIKRSEGELTFLNFEVWFAYRSFEHDAMFGRGERERDWWEARSGGYS